MKNITLAGRTGNAATLRRTQDGTPVLSFSVAVNDGYGDKKSTIWFDCSVWGKRGEALEQYIGKGTSVCVSGDLSKREHDGKTYLTVRVNEVTLMGGGEKQEREDTSADYRNAKSGGGSRPASFAQDLSDEIPFMMEWR